MPTAAEEVQSAMRLSRVRITKADFLPAWRRDREFMPHTIGTRARSRSRIYAGSEAVLLIGKSVTSSAEFPEIAEPSSSITIHCAKRKNGTSRNLAVKGMDTTQLLSRLKDRQSDRRRNHRVYLVSVWCLFLKGKRKN